ncbi:aquaporin [Bifidobacterium lemurum]|uniref:Aquaporin n=1 Tax=Bifidobacterium lemurum TaxID=1603886 RepID=A0A261FRZ8_9BIFI|nr:aquaporin [Bifidobacterium lemurum]OZG61962.1 aquaporin [Bifidobacterium lemurum]QOL35260.1 aquaporin [Bifidobacterium lemurum]
MNFRKYVAEFVGTIILVLVGCGTAVGSTALTGALGLEGSALAVASVVIALAFGLSIVIAAYSVGNVSGAHLNPAVSLAMLIDGRMSVVDFAGYVVAQVLGALAAAGILVGFTGSNASLGTNGYGDASALGTNAGQAFLVETVLTFVFVLVILGVTSKPEFGNIAGLVIGLSLVAVVLVGLPFTGTSVNPARSLGPALLAGGEALAQVWLFILAPLVGGALAAVLHRFVLAPAYLTDAE